MNYTADDLRNEPPTMSVERAAKYLGVSRAFAYKMVKDGRLKVLPVGSRHVKVLTLPLQRLLLGEGR